MKFNLQKNADGEPTDGYLLCLFLPGKIYKWGREPAQGIAIGEFVLDVLFLYLVKIMHLSVSTIFLSSSLFRSFRKYDLLKVGANDHIH